MTHTETQRQWFDTITTEVCRLLGWNETQYAAYMEKCGKQYLQYKQPQDPQGIDMLVGSKLFWAWWRTHWYMRDTQFLYHMISAYQDIYVELYKELHDVKTLVGKLYPNGIVLKASYDGMKQFVIDKKGEGV